MSLKKSRRLGRITNEPVAGAFRNSLKRLTESVLFPAILLTFFSAIVGGSGFIPNVGAVERSPFFTGVSTSNKTTSELPSPLPSEPISVASAPAPASVASVPAPASVASAPAPAFVASAPAPAAIPSGGSLDSSKAPVPPSASAVPNDSFARTPIPKEGSKEGSASAEAKKGALIKPAINLLLVLGLVFGFFYVLRRWSPKQNAPLPPEVTESLGRYPLTAKVHLNLIHFGGRLLLLSVGEEGAKTIAEITDPGEISTILAACRVKPQSGTGRKIATKSEGGPRDF